MKIILSRFVPLFIFCLVFQNQASAQAQTCGSYLLDQDTTDLVQMFAMIDESVLNRLSCRRSISCLSGYSVYGPTMDWAYMYRLGKESYSFQGFGMAPSQFYQIYEKLLDTVYPNYKIRDINLAKEHGLSADTLSWVRGDVGVPASYATADKRSVSQEEMFFINSALIKARSSAPDLVWTLKHYPGGFPELEFSEKIEVAFLDEYKEDIDKWLGFAENLFNNHSPNGLMLSHLTYNKENFKNEMDLLNSYKTKIHPFIEVNEYDQSQFDKLPASINPAIILSARERGFEGFIMPDWLDMQAIKRYSNPVLKEKGFLPDTIEALILMGTFSGFDFFSGIGDYITGQSSYLQIVSDNILTKLSGIEKVQFEKRLEVMLLGAFMRVLPVAFEKKENGYKTSFLDLIQARMKSKPTLSLGDLEKKIEDRYGDLAWSLDKAYFSGYEAYYSHFLEFIIESKGVLNTPNLLRLLTYPHSRSASHYKTVHNTGFLNTDLKNLAFYFGLVGDPKNGTDPIDPWNRSGVVALKLRESMVKVLAEKIGTPLQNKLFNEEFYWLAGESWFEFLNTSKEFKSCYDSIDWNSVKMKEVFSEMLSAYELKI